jgi:hypothetical protein
VLPIVRRQQVAKAAIELVHGNYNYQIIGIDTDDFNNVRY